MEEDAVSDVALATWKPPDAVSMVALATAELVQVMEETN